MLHAYAKSAVAKLPTISRPTSAAFDRRDCHITAKLCVNQGKPSFEDWHVYIIVLYIYNYIYVYINMYVVFKCEKFHGKSV